MKYFHLIFHEKNCIRFSVSQMNFDTTIISCYKNQIPSFVKDEMEQLYQNPFSSTASEHAANSEASTYVVRRGATPITIFLFQIKNKQVIVLNSAIRIDSDEISQFASYIFSHYESVTTIQFESIQTNITNSHFPFQQFNSSEDIVLDLPETAQEYFEKLGKSTRKNLKWDLKQPKRHFPTYCYKVYDADQINERITQDIINLNTARMSSKNKASTIDDNQIKWIEMIAKTHGFVGVITIDNRICAGAICSRVGANYFMHVIAHDPLYDDYRLGIICCYLTICEAIACGGKEYHFLWGKGEYKYRLLGVQRDLDTLVVFRSRIQQFFNIHIVLKNELTSLIRQSKLRLKKNTSSNTLPSRLIGMILNFSYKIKSLSRHIAMATRNAQR